MPDADPGRYGCPSREGKVELRPADPSLPGGCWVAGGSPAACRSPAERCNSDPGREAGRIGVSDAADSRAPRSPSAGDEGLSVDIPGFSWALSWTPPLATPSPPACVGTSLPAGCAVNGGDISDAGLGLRTAPSSSVCPKFVCDGSILSDSLRFGCAPYKASPRTGCRSAGGSVSCRGIAWPLAACPLSTGARAPSSIGGWAGTAGTSAVSVRLPPER